MTIGPSYHPRPSDSGPFPHSPHTPHPPRACWAPAAPPRPPTASSRGRSARPSTTRPWLIKVERRRKGLARVRFRGLSQGAAGQSGGQACLFSGGRGTEGKEDRGRQGPLRGNKADRGAKARHLLPRGRAHLIRGPHAILIPPPGSTPPHSGALVSWGGVTTRSELTRASYKSGTGETR